MPVGTLFKINGKSFPVPYRGLTGASSRFVEGLRNNNGVVISQPIGRNIWKHDNLEWRDLKRQEWEDILQEVKDFYSMVTFYSVFDRRIVTRKFYWGDVTDKVLWWEEAGQGLLRPKKYEWCKVNLIDVGSE